MISVSLVTRKLIKPYTPTPQNLKKHNISFIDEISPTMNVGIILFYTSNLPKQSIRRLEESLTKILVQFYPLAGRYTDGYHFVDCGDQGAEFIEAEAADDVELVDLVAKMKKVDNEQTNGLLPRPAVSATNPLLSIQITAFKRGGGLAIGVSISHVVFDASSIGTFIAAWSNAASKQEEKATIIPTFDLPSLLPCKNHPDDQLSGSSDPEPEPPSTTSNSNHNHDDNDNNKIVAKVLSFDKETITRLKLKLRPNDGGNGGGAAVSRVRVVCAFIAKALIAVDFAKHGRRRDCMINQAVSMRGRTTPPLPKHSIGNAVLQSVSRRIAADQTGNITTGELARVLRDAVDRTIAECADILSLEEEDAHRAIVGPWRNLIEQADSGEVNVIWFSDWSKFGLYEADFGWGKPEWAGIGPMPGDKLTVLMEKKDGDGIEAWVHLKESDMAYLEQSEQNKLFITE